MAINEYNVPSYVKSNLVLDLNATGITGTQNTWIDKSPNGFIGTLNNFNYNTTSGWNNNALSFDGVDDYVSIPYNNKFATNTFTTELYCKLSQVDTFWQSLISFGNPASSQGWQLHISAINTLLIYVNTNYRSINLSSNLKSNNYYHFVIVYNNGVFTLYFNGINVGTVNETITAWGNPSFIIEKQGAKNVNYVRFYNKALTLSEINQNYLNATNTPSDLSTSASNNKVTLNWKDKSLDSFQYRIKRNDTVLSTLNKNSTILKNELKIQRWVTSPTNLMIDGGSLGTGHLYTTSPINKSDLFTWQKFNSTHDITKPYATHGLCLYLDGKDGQGTQNTWFDKSGKGNHGNLSNFSYNNTSGWINGGLTYDGVKNTVLVKYFPYLNFGLNDFTFEIVFKRNSFGTDQYLLNQGTNSTDTSVSIAISSDNTIRAQFISNNTWVYISSSQKITDTMYHHLVYTRRRNNLYIYVDNVQISTIDITGKSIVNSTYDLCIGSFYTTNRYFNGTISLVRYYNRGLTNTEISQNYKQAMPYATDGLVLHLDAQNASGTTWIDLSGNGNNGTLKGFPTTMTTTSGWNNGALVFDGSDDYVEVLDSPSLDLSKNVTVEMLMKIDNPVTEYILEKSAHNSGTREFGLGIYLMNSQLRGIQTCYNGTSQTNQAYNTGDLGQYKHITVVKDIDTNTVKTYNNGKLMETTYGVSASTNGTDTLWIGRGYAGSYFNGQLKTIRIYNKALSEQEVQKNCQSALSMINNNTSGLILSLDATNGYGNQTTWYDGSGNGNNATLNNFTFDGSTNGWLNDGSLLFNSNNVSVGLTNGNIGTGDFTFYTKLKPNTTNAWVFNGVASQVILLINTNGAFSYLNGKILSSVITQNNTYFVVIRRTKGITQMYVNNVKQGADYADTNSIDLTTSQISYYYKGTISTIGVYNRGLSDAEIKQLYLDTMGLNKSCVLSYDFAGGSGTTITDKLNGVIGTLNGFSNPATASSGWQSDGLLLDGINDYISFTNSSSYANYTIEVLFTLLNYGIYNVPILDSTSVGIILQPNSWLSVILPNNNLGITSNIKAGIKYHLVFKSDQNGNTIYLNGIKGNSNTYKIADMISPTSFNIGKELQGEDAINAKFYLFNIYNKGLTDDEVWERYKECIPDRQYITNGLVLDLNAEGITSGAIWNDKSGYGNNGTLNGFANPSTSTSGWNKGKLVFDGVDDNVTFTPVSSSYQTQNRAIELVLNPKDVTTPAVGDKAIFFQTGVINIVRTNGAGNGIFNIILNWLDTSSVLQAVYIDANGLVSDKKNHILLNLYSDGTYKLIVNNNVVASITTRLSNFSSWNTSTSNAMIISGSQQPLEVYTFRIYNRTLSDSEITYNYNISTLLPQYAYEGTDYPESVVTLNDLNLTNIKSLKLINWMPSATTNDTVLAVLSADSGTTWKAWSGTVWQNVDINNETDLIAKGMTKDVVNALTQTSLESLRGTSTKLKLGYYLRTKVIDTAYNNDQLTITYTNTSNTDVTVGQVYNEGTGNATNFIDATPVVGSINNYEIMTYDSTNGEGTPIYASALLPPVNSTLSGAIDVANQKINYTWNSVSSASGYKLYINHSDGTSSVQDLTTTSYSYSINNEGIVSAYLVNYIYDLTYGYVESEKSNTVGIKTYPTAIPSDVIYSFNPESTVMNVSWKDTSKYEDGFKLVYSIDGATYVEMDIPSTTSSSTGSNYSADIPLNNIEESLRFYIRPYNNVGNGLNSTALVTLLTKPDYFQVGYVLGYAKYGWIDNTTSELSYRIFYSINGGELLTLDVTSDTITAEGKIYNAQIMIDTSSTISSYICTVDSNGNLGIPSARVNTSFADYKKVDAPTDFRVSWKSVGVAEYKWTCNNDDIIGYKLNYYINDGNNIVVDISCPRDNTSETHTYDIQLQNDKDTVVAYIQPYTLIDTGLESDAQSIAYIIVDKSAPTNFWKYKTDSGYVFTWDSKDYVDNYEIHYTINGVETVVKTQYTEFTLDVDLSVARNISIYMFANFSTLEKSATSRIIDFVPTLISGYLKTTVYTVDMVASSLNTRISQLKAKYIYISSMLTTNKNCIFKTPRIATKFVFYNANSFGYDAQLTVTKNIAKTHKDILILNNTGIRVIYKINTKFINFATTLRFYDEMASVSKNIKSNFADSLTLVNNNIKGKGLIGISICNKDLINAKLSVVSIFYEIVSSKNGYVGYVIWTRNQLIYGVYTEVHKIRISCIGDSITAGHPNYWAENEINHAPNSGTGRITSQYEYWLQKRLMGDYEVINNGYGSDTTERMLNRFDKDVLSGTPQYCIIQGGTNDINWAMVENKGNQEYLDDKMATARKNIITMVNKCLANGIIPIVGTLIPRTSAQGIYRQAIWDYNKWIIDYCNSRDGLYYADFYNAGKDNIPPTPLEEPTVAGNLNPLYDGDSVFDTYGNLVRRGYGVHPNDIGYKLMAEAIPLNIFKGMQTGIKLYVDESCLVEENNNGTDIYESIYNITFNNLDRGRMKTISRYIKNIGNQPILYSLYVSKENGIDMQLSLDGVNFYDSINGKLDNETINKIYMRVIVPRAGVIPSVETVLSTRSIKIL